MQGKKVKTRRSSTQYEDYLRPTPTSNGSRMTMDRLGDKNEEIPYF